jgi:DNA repair exonuclease SbcCD ATPase subunit
VRIHRIKLRNYAGVAESELKFADEGITIIEGDNEAGKTSHIEALHLILTYPDSSNASAVKAVQPVRRDVGAEVEVEISTGQYRFVYFKRWHRDKQTTLELLQPHHDNFRGREAHEKVESILDETLDKMLWSALRLQQGKELKQAGFEGVPSLGQALDLAAGGDQVGDRENDLWDRIRQERDRYWTPTGQVNAERNTSASEVRTAQDEVGKVETLLRELDNATDEMARLGDDKKTLEARQHEQESIEAGLAERSAAVERLQGEVDQLGAKREAATFERDMWITASERREELVNEVVSRKQTLDARQAEFEAAEPARAAATGLAASTRKLLEQARESLAAAEQEQRQARDDSDYRRRQIEVEQLTERRDRVIEAQQRLNAAEAVLESARVDDDLLARIEAAHLEVAKARAAADADAATVETTALRDLDLEIDGQKLPLSLGAIDRRAVTNEIELLVPDVVKLRVRPGAEARALTDRVNATVAQLNGLCESCGVTDLEAAKAAAAARTNAERDKREAADGIQQDLRDLTLDVLTEKVERLETGIAAYTATRPSETALPDDPDAAQDRLDATNAALEECKAESEVCETAADRADTALQEMKIKDAVLTEQLKQDRLALVQAERSLTEARSERSDQAIETELATAEEKLKGAIDKLTAAEADLAAEDPDSLKALLQNAHDAKARAAGELRRNQDRRSELRGMLTVRGEEGLAQQLDAAKTRLQHLDRERDRLEARAEAARLLHKTFASRRAQAHQRYVAPFRERIENLGHIVFDASFEVELDDDLRVTRRTLDGQTLDFEQLSTGTQEQLGILSRLACATIVAKDGGAPVIIDDALGWTDPRRLKRMGATIAVAGRDCQVIILTCTPGRYASVGNATVVRLP